MRQIPNPRLAQTTYMIVTEIQDYQILEVTNTALKPISCHALHTPALPWTKSNHIVRKIKCNKGLAARF